MLRKLDFFRKLTQFSFYISLAIYSLIGFTSGSIDSSYGNSGVSKYTIPIQGATIMDIVMLPNDDILVGGSNLNTQTTLAFARFNKQGNLTPSFGNGNGYINYSTPTVPTAIIEGFSVDANQNIYAVGHDRHLSDNAYIFKLNPSGGLDNQFANNGVYSHSSHPRLPTGYDTEFAAVALQPDNKVIIVGYSLSSNSASRGAFILRLLPDGTPDNNFGLFSDGLVFFGQFPIPQPSIDKALPESVKILDSGEIVVGGYLNHAAWGSFVARFTNNGLLDSTFNNSSGIYLLDVSSWVTGWAGFIEVDRLGNVYLLTRINPTGSHFPQCVVTKLKYNGQIDTSYGSNGHNLLIPPTGSVYNCGSIAAASNGGMAIAVMDRYPVPGATYNGPAKILRLNKNGHLVTNFGNNGVATIGVPYITSSTYLAGLFNHTFAEPQSDGKLVVAIGEYQANSVGYTLARVNDHSDSFSVNPSRFTAKAMQPSNTWITSNMIQIQNMAIDNSAIIEIENGEYSLNGQVYTSASGWINNNDLIIVRNKTIQGAATTRLILGGDRDRKNAGMIRGKRIVLEFLISTDPIIADSELEDPSPIIPISALP